MGDQLKTYWKKGILSLLLLGMFFGNISAQIEVLSALDSTNILIGDQLYLKVIANHDKDVVVQDVDLDGLGNVPDLEVLKTGDWDTLATTPVTIVEKKILITAFDTGQVVIPALPVRFTLSGNASVVNTEATNLNVIPLTVDSLELAPIKEIIEEPVNWEDWMPYLLGLLALMLIGFLIYYFIKKQSKTESVTEEEVVIKEPAHIIAFRKLAALREQKLWQAGAIKQYHSELTYIFREYLENRYDIQALENTSSEVLRQLEKEGFNDEQKRRTSELLQTADLVKFAKSKPGPDVHERVLGYVEDFVKTTQAIPVDPETTNDSSI